VVRILSGALLIPSSFLRIRLEPTQLLAIS